MNTTLRAILILTITLSFWLPRAGVAEAAKWISPAGYSHWHVSDACDGNLDIMAAIFEDDGLAEDFTELRNFDAIIYSGYSGTLKEPERFMEEIPTSDIYTPIIVGSVSLIVHYVPTPVRVFDDDTRTIIETNFVGQATMELSHLEPGTTILVSLSGATANYFLAQASNDCTS